MVDQNDDNTDNTEEILDLLSKTKDIGFEYRKLEILDSKGRTTEAEQVINKIRTLNLSEVEKNNLNLFC